MAWPGPAPLPWGLALLLFGVALLPTGELIRRVGARFAGAWAADDPIERVVLDLFLGVGPLYVLGSLPFDLYTAALPAVVMVGGAVALLLLFGGERRGIVRTTPGPRLAFERLAAPGVLAVLGASGLLYVLEVAAAAATPTGNTFDSSILTIFGGLLSAHHVLPTSYVPVAPLGITYPQGTTAVLGAAAAIFHLPAARAPVLVTPLFLALGPLAAYAWGRRWFGSPAHGVAFGLFFALVASWTRVLVAGSNDFVLAFPLVLLLWGAVPRWFAGTLPSWGDVVGFGALAGLSAAFNPVGAQLTFLALPLVAAAMGAAPRHSPGRWAVRLLGALGTALLFVLPSLFELVQGRASSQLVPGALRSLRARRRACRWPRSSGRSIRCCSVRRTSGSPRSRCSGPSSPYCWSVGWPSSCCRSDARTAGSVRSGGSRPPGCWSRAPCCCSCRRRCSSGGRSARSGR